MSSIQFNAEAAGPKSFSSKAQRAVLKAIDTAIAAGSNAWSSPETREGAVQQILHDQQAKGETLMHCEEKAAVGAAIVPHTVDTLLLLTAEILQKRYGRHGNVYESGSAAITQDRLQWLHYRKPGSVSQPLATLVDDRLTVEQSVEGEVDDAKEEDADGEQWLSSAELMDQERALTDLAIFKHFDDFIASGSKQKLIRADHARQIYNNFDVGVYLAKKGWVRRDARAVGSRISDIVGRESSAGRKKVEVIDLMTRGSRAVPLRAKEIDYPSRQPYLKGQNPNLPIEEDELQFTSSPVVRRPATGAPIDLTEGLEYAPNDAHQARMQQPTLKRTQSSLRPSIASDMPLGQSATNRYKRPRQEGPGSFDEIVAGVPHYAGETSMGRTGVNRNPAAESRESAAPMPQYQKPKFIFARDQAEEAISDIYIAVQDFIHQEVKKTLSSDKAKPVFHADRDKSPVLHKLYRRIVGGGSEAGRYLTIMRYMSAEELLVALVGAFFYEDVFGTATSIVPDAGRIADGLKDKMKELMGPVADSFDEHINTRARQCEFLRGCFYQSMLTRVNNI